MLACGVGHGFGHHTATVDLKDLEIFLKVKAPVDPPDPDLADNRHRENTSPVTFTTSSLLQRNSASSSYTIAFSPSPAFMGALCRPLNAFWDRTVKGECFNSTALTYFVNSSNMVTDLVLFALPIPVIVGVRTTRKKKIALITIFSIGFITCGISAARLAYVVAQGSADITWEGVPLGILSAFESLGGVLCANLPIIYQLFKTAAQKISSSVSGQKSKSSNLQYAYDSRAYASKSHGRQNRHSTDSERWIRMPNESDSTEMQTHVQCMSPDIKADGLDNQLVGLLGTSLSRTLKRDGERGSSTLERVALGPNGEYVVHSLHGVLNSIFHDRLDMALIMEGRPPSVLPVDQGRTSRYLKDWHGRFVETMSSPRLSSQYGTSHVSGEDPDIMRIWYIIGKMYVAVPQDGSEDVWDQFRTEFETIVSLVESYLLRARQLSQKRTFSFDLGIVSPLYIVGVRCRDMSIRRRAILLLESCERREILWDSTLTAMAARRVMEFEESRDIWSKSLGRRVRNVTAVLDDDNGVSIEFE
ncbi:Zn(II)2Cys6 transcription factor [Aspergillus arachidicola]|uniref:Zn(II)2Cys6 transcription factor n=1 Tax=Aspergillus arachidicola TaxID=656916 RepID=A0A2G7G8D0_9EURO|nr:Zn(II)2Cys6 transcription factor [Aspergillus arachidicola]